MKTVWQVGDKTDCRGTITGFFWSNGEWWMNGLDDEGNQCEYTMNGLQPSPQSPLSEKQVEEEVYQVPNNCSNHKKEVAGISDMKALAEMIGDLHYETLAKLLDELSLKIYKDSVNDKKAGRVQIASLLESASSYFTSAFLEIDGAWRISKLYMDGN